MSDKGTVFQMHRKYINGCELVVLFGTTDNDEMLEGVAKEADIFEDKIREITKRHSDA